MDLPGAPAVEEANVRAIARRVCRHVLDANARLGHGNIVTKGMVDWVSKKIDGAGL